jgi:hypothetical protein
MEWESSKIIQTIENLQYDACVKTVGEIDEKYGNFRERFPKLFYSCLEPNFRIEELKELLHMREKAKEDKTPDFIRDVSVAEKFSQRWLYPVVGEPTLEQKKAAAKKVAQKQVQMENEMKSVNDDCET